MKMFRRPLAIGVTILACGLTVYFFQACKPRGSSVKSEGYKGGSAGCEAIPTANLYKDDNQIISWIDGQPVTDWPQEMNRRDKCLADYLTDNDAGRAKTFG